jgi:multiple sugar transport system permease protein
MTTVTSPAPGAPPGVASSGRAPAGRPRKRRQTGTNIAAVLIALFVAAPLYWMVATTFKSPSDIGSTPPSAVPEHPTLFNYSQAFGKYHFATYIENSVIVTLISTVLVLSLGIFAGYALARLPVRGRSGIMTALLMISLFPGVAVAAPLYLLMRDIGWLNSDQGLILAYTGLNLPFAIWILRNYFLTIPKVMEEVAWIDGASPSRTVVSVILPQALPGLFRVPDRADAQQRRQPPHHRRRHSPVRRPVHHPVRNDLRGRAGGHAADRAAGAGLPAGRGLRTDRRRRQGLSHPAPIHRTTRALRREPRAEKRSR